jgi:hypothetical protein
VLRLKGRVVGLGRACDDHGDALRAAMQQAVTAARQDAAVRAMGEGALRHLTLDLEAGGEPEVLVGGTFEAALAPLQPARQGLMLRHGERSAYLPANHVLARGMAAPLSRTVLALVTELQIPPRDLPDLRAAASTALYAVRSMRLVQGAPSALPATVERLAPVLATEPHDPASMAATAAAIARRLAGQVAPPANTGEAAPEPRPGTEPARRDASPDAHVDDSARGMRATLATLGVGGTYEPLADEWREVSAAPADQALVAYALARGARCAALPHAERARCREAALAVLAALEEVAPGEDDPRSAPACAALALLAVAELDADTLPDGRGTALSPGFRAALAERVARAARSTPGADAGSGSPGGAPPTAAMRAMALAAAVAGMDGGGPPVLPPAELAATRDAAWAALDAEGVPAWGAWLLVAERAEVRAGGARADSARVRLASRRGVLDRVNAALVAGQRAIEEDPDQPPDTWGAYPVRDAAGARATAQSARPMHVAALALAVCPPSTAEGRAAMIRSLGDGARFLAQLQIGPGMDYALRSPERAHGGIMAAPYEPAVVPAAQGMALLALVEAIEAAGPNPALPPHAAPGGASDGGE